MDTEILGPVVIFSSPVWGGMGILWKEGPATEGHSGGEQLCWHKWEAVPGTKHKLSKCNRRCPATTIPPFLLLSNNRKCGIVVTAGSLSEFSNPCLFPLLSSCVLVSANTFPSCCCPQCWDEHPCKYLPHILASVPHLSLPCIISSIFHTSWKNCFRFKLKF